MAYAFILNPSANRTRAESAESWLRMLIDKHWPGSRIYVTSSKSDIQIKVLEAAQLYDVIVACGGDGTVNEVFSQVVDLLPKYPKLVLSVLPMGSGNDFSKSVHFSTNPQVAIEQLKTALIHNIDYVVYSTNLGNGYMFNTLNIGLGGQINFEASKIKILRGPLIYIYSALKSVFKVVSAQIDLILDGVSVNEEMVMMTIANGSVEGGNFNVAPMAVNDDGNLDVVTVAPLPIWKLLPLLPLFLLGRQHWFKAVKFRKCKSLIFKSNLPIPLHVDGEQCGLEVTTLRVEIRKCELRVLSPAVGNQS
jgi:diacylglycerol kinase (ATP)